MATKKTTTRSKSTKAAAKPAAKPAAKTKKAAAAAAPAEAAEVAVRGTDSPVLKESHAPVVKESPVPAEAVKAEAPAVAEPAQAPAVAEEKPARTRKSKAAAKPAEAPAEEAPKAEEKPAEAPAPAAEAKPAAKPAVLKPRADGGMLREITPRPQQAGNPYKPMLATVVETIQETGNIKTLRVVLDDPEQMANFTYEPGQVGQLSVFGGGLVLDDPGGLDHPLEVADAGVVAIFLLLGALVLKILAEVAEGPGGLDILDQLGAQLLHPVVDLLLHFLQVGACQFIIHGHSPSIRRQDAPGRREAGPGRCRYS